MSATGAGYDLAVTTFSPDGRVFQVEYANKAVEKKGTVVGIKCIDGVVLGVEKMIVSKMLVKGSNRCITTVDKHAGMAFAGLPADARQLANKARSEGREYKSFYGHPIPGSVLAGRVAGHIHMHTLYWYLRPFGVASLLATYDSQEGPALYMMEPSGICNRYFATSVGKHKANAKAELAKLKLETITCKEAVVEIAKIIYKLHDDVKDKDFDLELSWLCEESKHLHVMVPEDIKDAAVEIGKECKQKAEMGSDSEEED